MLLHYLWKTFRLVATVILVLLFVRTFVVETGRVNGVSMEPTYIDNQTFLVNKFDLLFSKPERGQIIQCATPLGDALLIKRIIGLPGEQVHIKEGRVWITDAQGNDIQLAEPYLPAGTATQSMNRQPTDYPTLGANEYFVLGDNRRESGDSRHFGPITRQRIIGSVIHW